MAGHNQYQTAATALTTTSPAYTAYATEFVLRNEWENIWLREAPLLARIRDGKTNWNKEGLRKGNMMLLPVLLANASTTADGVTDANELTAITPYVTSGMTQAAFNIAHYRNALYKRSSEMQLINNTRGNWLAGVTAQLMDGFTNAIADDLASTAADSRTAVLGVQQVLASANTVGGIDQSADTDWASNYLAAGGAFSLDLIDDKIDAASPRRGNIDLITFAYSSTNNLFSKLRAALAPAERLVNVEFKAKYGFTNIEYLAATCVSDNRLTAGVICGFDTKTWWYVGDDRPQLHHDTALTGTDADEVMYNLWAGVGCSNPARNFRIAAVT